MEWDRKGTGRHPRWNRFGESKNQVQTNKKVTSNKRIAYRSGEIMLSTVAATYKYTRITNDKCEKPFKFNLFKCFLCSLWRSGFAFFIDGGSKIGAAVATAAELQRRARNVRANWISINYERALSNPVTVHLCQTEHVHCLHFRKFFRRMRARAVGSRSIVRSLSHCLSQNTRQKQFFDIFEHFQFTSEWVNEWVGCIHFVCCEL